MAKTLSERIAEKAAKKAAAAAAKSASNRTWADNTARTGKFKYGKITSK